ncbi:MAG: ATP-binding protein [Planctomycetota bacterium]
MSLPFVEAFAADPQALRGLRRRVRSELRGLRLQPHDAEIVLLVLDELVSNAIEHGGAYRTRGKRLQAGLFVDGDDLVLEFVDQDMPAREIAALRRTLAAGDVDIPDIEDERGRGLFLVLTSLQSITVDDRTATAEGMLMRGRFVGLSKA